MKQKDHRDLGFFQGRAAAGVVAMKGAYKFITTEASGKVQFTLFIIMTIAGFYFKISREDWMFQFIAVAMVLSTEAMNTAVEKLCDFIHPDYHERIGFIKDIAAGAVYFSAICALVIGGFIYIPKFI